MANTKTTAKPSPEAIAASKARLAERAARTIPTEGEAAAPAAAKKKVGTKKAPGLQPPAAAGNPVPLKKKRRVNAKVAASRKIREQEARFGPWVYDVPRAVFAQQVRDMAANRVERPAAVPASYKEGLGKQFSRPYPHKSAEEFRWKKTALTCMQRGMEAWAIRTLGTANDLRRGVQRSGTKGAHVTTSGKHILAAIRAQPDQRWLYDIMQSENVSTAAGGAPVAPQDKILSDNFDCD